MAKRVEIIKKEIAFQKYIFTVEEVHLRHELINGQMSDELIRLNLNRGDSVAALIHNPENDTILFTEQFRYATHEKGPGWLLEVPAGMLEKDEDPRAAMQRELIEEIGYSVESLQHISTFYLSPGGTSERIHLFYARVNPKDKTSHGGGLEKEGEDIRTVILSFEEARQKIVTGEIVDAKTIIGLQWLQLHPQS